MSKYKGLFTSDEDNHRYVPIAQADGIIDTMDYEPDAEPSEPLIKDEKIRKAILTWAKANDVTEVCYDSCWNEFKDRCFTISFDYDFDRHDGLTDRVSYTIAELCGEEE